MFRFLESKEKGNRGGTTFVQAENFAGVLEVVLARWWPSWLGVMRGKIEGELERFNAGFKGWCEGGREGR
jgi:hypothetical protein